MQSIAGAAPADRDDWGDAVSSRAWAAGRQWSLPDPDPEAQRVQYQVHVELPEIHVFSNSHRSISPLQ